MLDGGGYLRREVRRGDEPGGLLVPGEQRPEVQERDPPKLLDHVGLGDLVAVARLGFQLAQPGLNVNVTSKAAYAPAAWVSALDAPVARARRVAGRRVQEHGLGHDWR